eukprot:m.211161 g.211161  ORF g.211161 m.211161 type:complete len:139 (+) comp33104_c4_seq5:145-561(+)
MCCKLNMAMYVSTSQLRVSSDQTTQCQPQQQRIRRTPIKHPLISVKAYSKLCIGQVRVLRFVLMYTIHFVAPVEPYPVTMVHPKHGRCHLRHDWKRMANSVFTQRQHECQRQPNNNNKTSPSKGWARETSPAAADSSS